MKTSQLTVLERGMSAMRFLSLCVFVISSLVCAAEKLAISKQGQEIRAIAQDKTLTSAEKVTRLRALLDQHYPVPPILYQLANIDPAAAEESGLTLLRGAGTPRTEKLEVGRALLRDGKAHRFLKEFAPWLVAAVLEGGESEFMKQRVEHAFTAVGEYAYLASGFQGYKAEDFDACKDKRAIPVLIQCLHAPDEVYGEQLGCCIRGKLGESTGRDVARQNIPIALKRLGATEASDALLTALRTHHDYWLRHNSAYALAFLLKREDSRKVEAEIQALKEKDGRLFFFPFGLGLIERGDADGAQYLGFRYSIYAQQTDVSDVIYMLTQRVPVLKGFLHEKTAVFWREALTHPAWRTILTSDLSEPGYVRERSLSLYKDILEGVTSNQLVDLAPHIDEILKEAKNETVKSLSQDALTALQAK